MNDELTEIFIVQNKGLTLTSYKSDQIPRVGDILHFAHIGCFRVKSIVYRISDDGWVEENKLIYVEVFVEKYKEDEDDS